MVMLLSPITRLLLNFKITSQFGKSKKTLFNLFLSSGDNIYKFIPNHTDNILQEMLLFQKI